MKHLARDGVAWPTAIASRWPPRVSTCESPGGLTFDSADEFLGRGIELVCHATPAEALIALTSESPNVVLVPTDIVGMDPIAFVRATRSWADVPIIIGMAAGPSAVETGTRALALGASRLLDLPLNAGALAASVKHLGLPALESAAILHVGDLSLNPQSHQAARGGRVIELSPREFLLLSYLMRESPRVVSADELAEYLGLPAVSDPKSIRVMVGRIRRKLEDSSGDSLPLATIRGFGYRILGT
ncbi:two-component system KDP operon response regulator KdpE [Rhodoglobus vestalii]|uniref:Two-component system KDP operon response regulator KdpE n=1 Tax=Rhodoglobus vestalii TaxID=193384 RepID=A0A8H2K862_9MICO|nr:response regulator transcription factor [Rhodoglobus vestalii]TQO20628.1 two-component system KDP operon response regulator KdpE [Rhodoglobus vestalii]